MSASSAFRDAPTNLAEPAGILESVQILHSENVYYMSILYPSSNQVENLNEIIKSLREHLEGGLSEAVGDETAYELAVALLWHTDALLVQEGVELMKYLLKGRWDEYWPIVVGKTTDVSVGGVDDADDEEARSRLTQSGLNVSHDCNNGVMHYDACGGISGSRAEGQCSSSNSGAEDFEPYTPHCTGDTVADHTTNRELRVIPRGLAIQFATAPPPPEDEYGSEPLSLVCRRETSVASSGRRYDTTASPICFSTISPTATASAQSVQMSSAACDKSPGTADSGTDKHSWACEDAQMHHERLAQCYYHLAVGCTKLRNNDAALFYVNNMLRFNPGSEEGLLLRRLLCARLHLQRFLFFHVSIFLKALIFL